MAPMEASMVDELNAELRDVVGDYRFVEALRAAVRATSRATATYIQARFTSNTSSNGKLEKGSSGGGGAGSLGRGGSGGGEVGGEGQQLEVGVVRKPFPYVVPIVAKSCQVLLDETDRCTKVGLRFGG